MKNIIEDLGGFFDAEDSNKNKFRQMEPLMPKEPEIYTVWIQFDNDAAVQLMKVPVGQEAIIRIKEPTDTIFNSKDNLTFIDLNTNKKLKIFTTKVNK